MILASRHRLYADLALLLASGLWGFAFFFQKAAMNHVGPLTFLTARGIVAAVAVTLPALGEHQRRATSANRSFFCHAIAGGIVFFCGAWLQQCGMKTATVTNAGFLTALYVALTPFAEWAWTRKPPPSVMWVAALLSLLGTWFLSGAGFALWSVGDGLISLSACFWAIQVVVTRQAANHQRPLAYTAVGFATVAGLSALGAVSVEDVSFAALWAAAPDVAYVGLVSSAVAFTVLTIALQHTSAAEAAVIISTETLFAALAGYLLLDERLGGTGVVGAVLILASVLVIPASSLPAVARRRGC